MYQYPLVPNPENTAYCLKQAALTPENTAYFIYKEYRPAETLRIYYCSDSRAQWTLHHTAETESHSPLTLQYTVWITVEQLSTIASPIRVTPSILTKERKKDGKKRKNSEGKRTSKSGRHATGNAHQLASRTNPKGKYTILKARKYYQKERERRKEK